MGEADLHPQRRPEQRKRVIHVVAIADESEHEPLEAAEALLQRKDVGERLTRVLADSQTVDDGDRRLCRQFDDDLVGAGSRNQSVDEPIEVAGHVAHALASAEHRLMREVDGVAA